MSSVGDPGQGQVRVRHSAVGLNYIDIYQRTGLYPMQYPSCSAWRRRAWSTRSARACATSSPATASPIPARSAPMPRSACCRPSARSSCRTASTTGPPPRSCCKGTTAEYLLRRTYKVKKGQTILVHAAAGGVGLILCQWAKHLGATVIGTVGSDDKAQACARPWLRPRRSSTARELHQAGRARSPTARACRWSTTASARTPGTARSTA